MVSPQHLTTGELDASAYRALYASSPDGVLFTAPDGRVLAANPTACSILGRTEQEICALGRRGLADLSDPRWEGLLAEREQTGEAHGIARMLRGDGSAIEVEMSARLFTDADGAARSCTVIRDVTDRVRLERELENGRARLAEAERVAQIGSWEWDLATDTTKWSDGLFHIFGLTRDRFDPSFEGGIHRVLPEDREMIRAAITAALAERSSFTMQYRARRADGRVRTLRSQGDVVVDDDGEPVRLIGVVQDITDSTPALEIGAAGRSAVTGPPAPLTPRQLEILQLIASGMTNAEIAQRFVVSEGTIKWHVKQILAKTGSANRAAAVAQLLGEPGPVPRSHR